MRDRYDLKMEIDSAQQDLEKNLHELRGVISEKVDVRGKVRDQIDAKKDQVMGYVVRGREVVLDLVHRVKALVKERPMVIVGALGGLVLFSGLLLKIRHELAEGARHQLGPGDLGPRLSGEPSPGDRRYVLVEVV